MSELTDAATALVDLLEQRTDDFFGVHVRPHPAVTRLRAALAADAQRSAALELAAQKVVRDWPVVQQATKGTRLPRLEQYIYELRDALEGKGSQVDWRARAVAHARALVSVLVLKEKILEGTFGEQWLKEARETVDLDLQEYTFAAGYAAANKDGTLKEE